MITLTPTHKKIAMGLAIVIGLFLVWHFFIRKGKNDTASLFEKIKSKEKELQDCILKGGANCAGIKGDLGTLLHLHKKEVAKVEETAKAPAAAVVPAAETKTA